jgi:hypothetical protein
VADITEQMSSEILNPEYLKAIGVKSVSVNIQTGQWTINLMGEEKTTGWGYKTQTQPRVQGATLREALEKLSTKTAEIQTRRAAQLKKQAADAAKKAAEFEKQSKDYRASAKLLEEQATRLENSNG